MNEIYELCIETIDGTIHRLEKNVSYEKIKKYLELKKIEIESKKEKLEDESAEYVDKLVKELK